MGTPTTSIPLGFGSQTDFWSCASKTQMHRDYASPICLQRGAFGQFVVRKKSRDAVRLASIRLAACYLVLSLSQCRQSPVVPTLAGIHKGPWGIGLLSHLKTLFMVIFDFCLFSSSIINVYFQDNCELSWNASAKYLNSLEHHRTQGWIQAWKSLDLCWTFSEEVDS